MNFHYARYENVKKSVPPKFKNEASDHLKANKNMYLSSDIIRNIYKSIYTANVLSAESTDVCLRTKSQDN